MVEEGAASVNLSAADLIDAADLDAARTAIAGVTLRTPVIACDELAQATGSPVALKAECLQRGGSFKLRGALAKVAALGARAGHGLVTASAGNHARAVAVAAQTQDITCDVFMPIGGGGLASGLGIALRRAGADVELVGVQATACAPYAELLGVSGSAASCEASPRNTIADGIAIKRPGALTLPLLRELVSSVETVSEDEIADAIAFLCETAKLVAEGAGAVSVAALLAGRLASARGTTVAIISGGNVDSGLLAEVLRRHETVEGRRVRMFTRVRDRPGGLAELLNLVAQARANLVNIDHVREAVPLHVRETGVELTLETRGKAHTEEVLAVLSDAGYDVTLE